MDRIERVKGFLAQRPNDVFLLHALALEYVKAGAEDDARACFERVLEVDPGYTGTYYHLAKLLERKGERETAIAVYEKGMEACQAAGDGHALRELQAAYEDYTF